MVVLLAWFLLFPIDLLTREGGHARIEVSLAVTSMVFLLRPEATVGQTVASNFVPVFFPDPLDLTPVDELGA